MPTWQLCLFLRRCHSQRDCRPYEADSFSIQVNASTCDVRAPQCESLTAEGIPMPNDTTGRRICRSGHVVEDSALYGQAEADYRNGYFFGDIRGFVKAPKTTNSPRTIYAQYPDSEALVEVNSSSNPETCCPP